MSEIPKEKLDELLEPLRLVDESAQKRFYLLFSVRERFGKTGVEILRSIQNSGENLTDEEMISRIASEMSR